MPSTLCLARACENFLYGFQGRAERAAPPCVHPARVSALLLAKRQTLSAVRARAPAGTSACDRTGSSAFAPYGARRAAARALHVPRLSPDRPHHAGERAPRRNSLSISDRGRGDKITVRALQLSGLGILLNGDRAPLELIRGTLPAASHNSLTKRPAVRRIMLVASTAHTLACAVPDVLLSVGSPSTAMTLQCTERRSAS